MVKQILNSFFMSEFLTYIDHSNFGFLNQIVRVSTTISSHKVATHETLVETEDLISNTNS